jgi:hypothetical protein
LSLQIRRSSSLFQLFNASAVITVTSRNKILKRLLSGTNSTYGFIFPTDYYYRRSLTQKTYPTQQQHQQTRTFRRRTRKCARSHTNQSLFTSASSREIVTSGKIEAKVEILDRKWSSRSRSRIIVRLHTKQPESESRP